MLLNQPGFKFCYCILVFRGEAWGLSYFPLSSLTFSVDCYLSLFVALFSQPPIKQTLVLETHMLLVDPQK